MAEHEGGARGWAQQNIQMPRDLVKIFRAESAQRQPHGVKVNGTAAVALFLGLPDELRERLAHWVLTTSWSNPDGVTPEGAMTVFAEALAEPDDGGHYIDRILDPSLLKRARENPGGEDGRKAG